MKTRIYAAPAVKVLRGLVKLKPLKRWNNIVLNMETKGVQTPTTKSQLLWTKCVFKHQHWSIFPDAWFQIKQIWAFSPTCSKKNIKIIKHVK